MAWVVIEAFSVTIEFCQPCVAIEIQCRDRVWSWARLRSQQGPPCVATKFSKGGVATGYFSVATHKTSLRA